MPNHASRQARILNSWDADFAALSQQVASLEINYRDLRTDIEQNFAAITAKLDNRSHTPWVAIWSALGVMIAAFVATGSLALSPVRDGMAELRSDQRTEISSRRANDDEMRNRIIDIGRRLSFVEGEMHGHSTQ